MAVEALKQLTSAKSDRPILGYELRDMDLTSALVVPDDERGVETQFFVRRQPGSSGGREAPWSDFRLCAYIGYEWEEICSGCIRVDYGVSESGIGTARASKKRLLDLQAQEGGVMRDEAGTKRPTLEMDVFYEQLRQYGLEFGPAFHTLAEAQWAGTACRAVVAVHRESDYVVHPCSLDALLHLPMVALTQDPTRSKSTAIPAKVRRIWLASSGLNHQTTVTLNATSKVVAEDRRGCEVESYALSPDRDRVLAEMEGLRLTVVNDMVDVMAGQDATERDRTWNLVWKPDIDLMTRSDIDLWCMQNHQQQEKSAGDEPTDFYRDLAFLHYSYLKQVTAMDIPLDQPHLLKYVRWGREQVRQIESGRLPHWEPEWEMLAHDLDRRQIIEDQLEKTNAQGKAHVAVARNLQQMLVGQLDPLELLFGSPLLEDLYAELSSGEIPCFRQLDQYLKLYAHKNPNAQFLEIGAGTGGTTATILRSLESDSSQFELTGALYQDFTYSDISEAFFDAAKTRFEKYPNLLFRKLDIEQAVTDQGFTQASYDVIVAANVLHATKDLGATLQSVQQLLRPGGKLILFEITASDLGRSGFIMGLLPGWWLSSEAYRSRGPCVPPSTWNNLLQNGGFNGLEHEFRDYHSNGCHELSVLVSTKPRPSVLLQQSLPPVTGIVNIVPGLTVDPEDEGKAKYALSIQRYLDEAGLPRKLVDMDKISSATSLTIVTADLDLKRPFLESLNPEEFAGLQHLIRHSQNVVWLTRTVDDGSSSPAYNMVTGLARVSHAEHEGTRFLRIGIEPGPTHEPTQEQIQGLIQAIQQMLAADSADTFEMEFEQRDGLFQIPRLQLDTACQEAIHESLYPQASRDIPWQNASVPLKLTTEIPGLLESLRFVEDASQHFPLPEDEVEIEVRAVGLNFKDCLIALGRVPADTLGNECAGFVTQVGASCHAKFTVGDRVCMSTAEAFKTHARSKAQCVCPLPDSMSFTTAAAIPTQFVTAWTSLLEIGRLARGEKVLIHAGAGGTGQAAVQISQYIGAEVFVTVGSEAKKELLMSTYAIPEDHIFYSRDTSFATGIKSATGGRGVDLILNSLSGDSLLASWNCLASYGRFVEIGKKDILDNARLPMLPFNKGVTFSAFDGSIWMHERPEQAERGIRAIMNLFEQGVFRVASPMQVRSVADVQQAFATLADGKTSGKTVIEVRPDAIVPTTIRPKPTHGIFPAAATYVLAGGFGGIGRSIARWMADRGARNLLILSRAGPQTPEAHSLMEELQGAGLTIYAPACDITDQQALERVLSEFRLIVPPIRGCIQASMVLQDTLHTDMTHMQWTAAIQPKVAGSWNLHTFLEQQPLDFFVCLSSVSGIAGQRGQSNYAAGNTFQDSLARYRVSRGQPAVSLDLGAMVDDGFLAQNQAIRDRLLGGGSMVPITREKFLAVLEYYCCPSTIAGLKPGQLTIANCQTIFGINSPQAMYARGLDSPSWMQRPIFRFLHSLPAPNQQTSTSGTQHRDFRGELAQAASLDDATQIIADALIAKLVRSLSGLCAEDIEGSTPIVSCGVDSLLAVEIRSWLGKMFQADVPTFEILGGMTFERLGRLVAIRSLGKKGWTQ